MHTGNNLKLKIISHKEAGHPDLDIHYNLDELQALCASEFQLAHGLGDVRIQTLEGEYHLIQELYQEYGYNDVIIFPSS